jgi:hypothetical protein
MSPKIFGWIGKELWSAVLRQNYIRDISRQKQADILLCLMSVS